MATEAITATNLRRKLAGALKSVLSGGEPVEVTRHGKPVAALIGAADLALLKLAKAPGSEVYVPTLIPPENVLAVGPVVVMGASEKSATIGAVETDGDGAPTNLLDL